MVERLAASRSHSTYPKMEKIFGIVPYIPQAFMDWSEVSQEFAPKGFSPEAPDRIPAEKSPPL